MKPSSFYGPKKTTVNGKGTGAGNVDVFGGITLTLPLKSAKASAKAEANLKKGEAITKKKVVAHKPERKTTATYDENDSYSEDSPSLKASKASNS